MTVPGRDDFIFLRKHADWLDCRGQSRFFRGHVVGPHAGDRADGIYAEWTWDGQALVVRNDRYGAAPLFYAAGAGWVAVSPSIATLIAEGAPAAFDDDALAVFFRLGFFVGDDTPFRHIRAVPPGASLTWRDGELAVGGGYTIPAPSHVTRDQALDGFIATFRQAMARRLPHDDRAVVPLSGGRDSRHILYEMGALGGPPRCAVTLPRYPPRPHEDERLAPIVAAAAGVPHVMLEQDADRFDAELLKNRQTHFCADEHAWYVPLVEALGSASTVYDGLGGALSVPSRFLNGEVLALFEANQTEELARRLLDSFALYDETFLSSIVAPAHRGATSRSRAIARLAAELARHATAPDPVKSFNFWNRIRRELALVPYAMMRDIPVVYSPYLDKDVYDFMMSLAPTVLAPNLARADKSFHSDAIHRAFPQHAHIPFENSAAAPKVDASAHYASFATAVAKHLFARSDVKGALLNRRYAFSRLALALARRRYRESHPWLSVLSLYLFDLDALAAGRLESAADGRRPSRRPRRDVIAMVPPERQALAS